MERKKKKRNGTLIFDELEGPWGLPPGEKTPSLLETLKLYREERKEEKAEAREKRAKWRAKMRAAIAETFPVFQKPEEADKLEEGMKQTKKFEETPKILDWEQPKELTFFEKQRTEQLLANRYGKYPPFDIEPFPHVRQRTVVPMSPEDRMRRQAFLRAQLLHPDEPIGERFRPINPIRRVYRIPLDRFETLLRVRYGTEKAYYTRTFLGGSLLLLSASYFMFYWVKYNQKTWEKPGWKFYKTPVVNYGEPVVKRTDFGAYGFDERTAMRDMKTSANSPRVPADY